jgi:hypothetical protein
MNEAFPLPSPDLHMTQQRVFQIVSNLTQLIAASFNKTRVIPSLGNHEVWPPSQFPGLGSELTTSVFATVGKMWDRWLPSSQSKSDFSSLGCFVSDISANLSIISLNTLWCDRGNILAELDLVGDSAEKVFDWLESQLEHLMMNNKKVWITGHVPLNAQYSMRSCINRYIDIITKYQSIIPAQFYGIHFHLLLFSYTVFISIIQ